MGKGWLLKGTNRVSDFADGMPERSERFRGLFDATERLGDLINAFLDQHEDLMEFRRDDATRDVGMVVVASFGKALKTFQAISRLCASGFGEDALLLVRANVNLILNLRYILAAPDATERVKNFIAYSYAERERLLKDGYGETVNWRPGWLSDEEMKRRTKEWTGTSIAKRAEGVPPLHYLQGYKFYSSFEHSDALALDSYVTIHDDGFLEIQAGQRDEYVGLALVHSWSVMAEVFVATCQHFKINITNTERELQETWPKLQP